MTTFNNKDWRLLPSFLNLTTLSSFSTLRIFRLNFSIRSVVYRHRVFIFIFTTLLCLFYLNPISVKFIKCYNIKVRLIKNIPIFNLIVSIGFSILVLIRFFFFFFYKTHPLRPLLSLYSSHALYKRTK